MKLNSLPILKSSWGSAFEIEFKSNYFKSLNNFLDVEESKGTICPKLNDVFKAFELTPLDEVKVVIIGQDPYHSNEIDVNNTLLHAHGMSFSIPKESNKIPPSLRNIFKELNNDLGVPVPLHGDLTSWAKQGVLLMNATLTVRIHEAGSHQGEGWEVFTDKMIRELSSKRTGVIFLLWGKYAQAKKDLIDDRKHTIFEAPHPSPFSAYKGFFGCQHFSKVNDVLRLKGDKEIEWEIK